jgi:hypothetical protein
MATTCHITSALLLIFVLGSSGTSLAQPLLGRPSFAGHGPSTDQQPAPSPVGNLNVSAVGGIVTLTFDLPAQPGQTYTVTVEVSTNAGRTFDLNPKSVTGDIGRGIAGGAGKRIVWESARDIESMQMDLFRYRVMQTVERVEMPSPDKSNAAGTGPTGGTQSRPPTMATQPPPPVARPAMAKRRSSATTWTSVGIMGVGGTIAALATFGSLKANVCFAFTPQSATECTDEGNVNSRLLLVGSGIAAGGAALWTLGKTSYAPAEVVPVRRGIFVRGRVTF